MRDRISLTRCKPSPDGIAQAFIIARKFICADPCALILGDNIFYGNELIQDLCQAAAKKSGAIIFAYPVHDPERYGVVEFNRREKVVSLEEKPKNPKSRYAVTGVYFYDNQVIDIGVSLNPSGRSGLEITDVNKRYLERGRLDVFLMGRGHAWLDTGTHESLLKARKFLFRLSNNGKG